MKLITIKGNGSKATLRLELPFSIDKNCKVGIHAIHCEPKVMKNTAVRVNIAASVSIAKKGDPAFGQPTYREFFKTIEFSSGSPTLKQIIDSLMDDFREFKSEIKDTLKRDGYKLEERLFDENQLNFTLENGEVRADLPPLNITLDKEMENYVKYLLIPSKTIEIHSNIVVPSFANDDYSNHRHKEENLLFVFSNDTTLHKPNIPLYLPVLEERIHQIDLYIKDDKGEPYELDNFKVYLHLSTDQ